MSLAFQAMLLEFDSLYPLQFVVCTGVTVAEWLMSLNVAQDYMGSIPIRHPCVY